MTDLLQPNHRVLGPIMKSTAPTHAILLRDPQAVAGPGRDVHFPLALLRKPSPSAIPGPSEGQVLEERLTQHLQEMCQRPAAQCRAFAQSYAQVLQQQSTECLDLILRATKHKAPTAFTLMENFYRALQELHVPAPPSMTAQVHTPNPGSPPQWADNRPPPSTRGGSPPQKVNKVNAHPEEQTGRLPQPLWRPPPPV